MTDLNRLKVLAERALDCTFDSYVALLASAKPQEILGLIDEVERLRSRLEIDGRIPHDGISCRDETIKALDEKCDKLKAENNALRKFSAEAYQVLGALDAPENVLDNASDAANGVPLRHETLLPFFADDYESIRKDAERYRFYRQGFVSPSELDTNIDAALEGATQ
ncbi:TPA: hypothetical protein L5R00_005950 [Pseudomonas aeruginosa]|nr:hypothetical protein [Pseudomonas aeruginosa]